MVILTGTGGHAKVVFEALISTGYKESHIFPYDGKLDKAGSTFMGQTIQAPEFPQDMDGKHMHIAIGDNPIRKKLFHEATNLGGKGKTIIHNRADISSTAHIARGVFVASGAIIAAMAKVGEGTIINHNSIVDHDCKIGSFSHIAPGAILGGQVSIGSNVLVGSRAVILPGIKVEKDVIIAAGSIVTKSINSGHIWIGTSLKS